MRAALAVLILFAAAGASHAQTPAAGFLRRLDPADVIDAPPAPGSAQAQAERAEWLASASGEGSPAWRQAAADDAAFGGPAPALMFACAIGARLDERDAPRLNALLRRTLIDVEAAAQPLKRHFARPRPYEGDDAARLCIAMPPERRRGTATSYPSSSAALGVVWAEIVDVATDRRAEEAVIARGLQIGEGRLACRVHFRSDVQAGRRLGDAVVRALFRDPAFQREFTAVRAEVARALPNAVAPSGCPARVG